MLKTKRYLFFGFLFLASVVCRASDSTSDEAWGFRFFRNFAPDEYGYSPQNWAVVQDSVGILYFGNQSGILEYDGVSWRLIELPNWTARSLAVDARGVIYVGGSSEFGYLTKDRSGSTVYRSLMPYLEPGQKPTSQIYTILTSEAGVWFHSLYALYLWDGNRIEAFSSDKAYSGFYQCKGNIYVRLEDQGLMRFTTNGLIDLPEGSFFKDKQIYALLPWDENSILAGTRNHGLFIITNNGVMPIDSPLNDLLKQLNISKGIRLAGGGFAFTTLKEGLVTADSQGQIQFQFHSKNGLRDNAAYHLYEDMEGNLWITLNRGLAMLEAKSPFTFFNDDIGLRGIVTSITSHQNGIFVGTTDGLFCIQYPIHGPPVIKKVGGIQRTCWDLASDGVYLYATTSDGLYRISELTADQIVMDRIRALCISSHHSGWLFYTTPTGIRGIRLRKPLSRSIDIAGGINTACNLVEDSKGSLWVGTQNHGFYRIDFKIPGVQTNVTCFDTSCGLPATGGCVSFVRNHIGFSTSAGLYAVSEEWGRVLPDTTFGQQFTGNNRGVFRVVENVDGACWIHSENRNFLALPDSIGYQLVETPFLRLSAHQINSILFDHNRVWFGGTDGLVLFQRDMSIQERRRYPCLIRNVWLNQDSLLQTEFKGTVRIPYRLRDIRFEYAAPFYQGGQSMKYQFKLEGYDSRWSNWSSETLHDFTNLGPGTYRFTVHARNIYDEKSEMADFRFRILPPWYRTPVCYVFYLMTLVVLLYGIVKWRTLAITRKKEQLEDVVKVRTEQILNQKIQLEEQSSKLKEMDRIKSRFFANISHEFRTPLTLIIGPLQKMMESSKDSPQLKRMLRQAQNLESLINQLLDLSRLENNRMKLNRQPVEVVAFIRNIWSEFRAHAQGKKIAYTFWSESEKVILSLDRDKIAKVMINLLANAFKFTSEGGEISITLKQQEASFVIEVKDTGIGIPEVHLDHIFERFYQVDDSASRRYAGSGIGLALAKELVVLHKGKISVDSREGSGTVFTVLLPISSHADQSIESDEPAEENVLTAPPLDGDTSKVCESALEENEGESILVVEDHTDMRRYICEVLSPNYQTYEADSGDSGYKEACHLLPDLIISDIMMPGSDGYELCRKIKGDIRTSHIPVILLTAKAADEHVVEGLETGADDYIIKPFNPTILETRVKNLISLRRQLQERFQRDMLLQPAEIQVSSMDREFLERLKSVVENHIADSEFDIGELNEEFYMSRATLYRKIRALTGQPPKQFVQSYRLKRAAQLLKEDYGSVTEVAFAVGFSSSAYFTKCFKEQFNILPSTLTA